MTSRNCTLHLLLSKPSLAAPLFLLCAASLFAQTPSFVSFDAPDAGTGPVQGTVGASINQHGVIAGYYIDNSNVSHGFVRSANGTITEFDPPDMTHTTVQSINSVGQITGFAITSHNTTQGFVRRVNGSFVHITVPGSRLTQPWRINDNGMITGLYSDASGVIHGFTFAAGVYTTIDDPAASLSLGEGTRARAINIGNFITGYYDDEHTAGVRAFVRDSLGNFTNFDAVSGGSLAVFPVAINMSGQIAGGYYNSDFVTHAFIRDALGQVTDFDVAGANGTQAVDMNDQGIIVGQWTDSLFITQGFLRTQTGAVQTFSAPGHNSGIFPFAINKGGTITGYYFDVNSTSHGFVR